MLILVISICKFAINPSLSSLTIRSERLAELDLRGNELVEASNLDQLASLKSCDLSKLSLVMFSLQKITANSVRLQRPRNSGHLWDRSSLQPGDPQHI